jgi:heterodisulfide reductase subunit B2
MRMGYFPGCSMGGSSVEYGESLMVVTKALGLELVEIEDWNCCGASAAHNLNHDLAIALPARTLATAEKMGLEEILVPCAACFNRLSAAQHAILKDAALKERISSQIGMPVNGTAKIRNILDVLQQLITPEMEKKFAHKFDHQVACYYGCLLVRPKEIAQFDRVEDPVVMDQMMEKTGAQPLDWAFKTECCGAGFSVSRTDLVAKLCARILDDAVLRGAEAIIVACAMCQSNLDMRRGEIEKLAGKKYEVPVLFITQALGMAMGIDDRRLGLHRHLVPVVFKQRDLKAAQSEPVPVEMES